jgi:hypothetical protein
MPDLVITPPSKQEPPKRPDKFTRKAVEMTAPEAEGRMLFIDLGFFKYGTDDKTHAGSIFLSLVLLLCMAVIGILGLFNSNTEATKAALAVFSAAFSFVAGVAIGRGTSFKKRKKSAFWDED